MSWTRHSETEGELGLTRDRHSSRSCARCCVWCTCGRLSRSLERRRLGLRSRDPDAPRVRLVLLRVRSAGRFQTESRQLARSQTTPTSRRSERGSSSAPVTVRGSSCSPARPAWSPRASIPVVMSRQPVLITFRTTPVHLTTGVASARGLSNPARVGRKYAATPTTRPNSERSFASSR